MCVYGATNFTSCRQSQLNFFYLLLQSTTTTCIIMAEIMRVTTELRTGRFIQTHSPSHGYNNNNKGNGKNLLAVINGLFGYFSIDWRHRSQPNTHINIYTR